MASEGRKLPVLALVAIGVMVLAGIVYLIAMALPYWHVVYAVGAGGDTPRVGHYGLWVSCELLLYTVVCSNSTLYTAGWLLAVRALHVLGMMFGTGALVMMVLYAFVPHEKWTKTFKLSAVVSALCAGVLVMIGDIVYGASISQGKGRPYHNIHTAYEQFSFQLSWSFGLSVTASVLCIISAVLIGFARTRRHRY